MTTCTTRALGQPAEASGDRPSFRPNVDIIEQDDSLVLLADIPGADESHTDVTLNDNILTIKGVVNLPQFEGYSLAWREYHNGDFERSFTVPREIDRDGIAATVTDGVLRVTLPKIPDAGVRRIEVKPA